MKHLTIPFAVASMMTLACSDASLPEVPATTVSDSQSSAMLLVSQQEKLTASDSALQERLRELGYKVALASDAAQWSAQQRFVDLIVVSPDSNRGDCEDIARSGTPILALDATCMHDLRMLDSLEQNSEPGSSQVTVQSEHPLAAGLMGPLQLTGEQSINYSSTLGDGALQIAVHESDLAPSIFAYERDEPMLSLQAPARRVGWLVDSAARFAPQAWQLFDASVRWVAQPHVLVLTQGKSPSRSESFMLTRLKEELGAQVEARWASGSHETLMAKAARARLVILSHGSYSPALTEDLSALDVPIVSLEPTTLSTLDMLSSGTPRATGTMELQTTSLLLPSSHGLSPEKQRTVALSSLPITMAWARPAPDAIVVASITGNPERASLFALAAQPDATQGPAARRYAFLVGPKAMSNFTPIAWSHFDRSIRWSARLHDDGSPCLGRPDGVRCESSCATANQCQAELCVAVETSEASLGMCDASQAPSRLSPSARQW